MASLMTSEDVRMTTTNRLARLLLLLTFPLAVLFVLQSAASVSAAATARRPAITMFAVNKSVLPAGGGIVALQAKTYSATSCSLVLESAQHVTVIYPRSTTICDGSYRITVGPNHEDAPVLVVFVYLARRGGIVTRRVLRLRVAPAAPIGHPAPTPSPSPAPITQPTASLAISPSNLPSGGGTVTMTYAAQNALRCTLSSTPSLWQGSATQAVNCNSTYQVTVGPASSAAEWTITFTATAPGGQTVSSTQSLSEDGPSTSQSQNWSGYVVPSSTLVTDASGEWTVPTLNCSTTPNAGAATWVGIGGYGWPTGGSSGALLQTGVTTDCVSGVQENVGWWELVPTSPNQNWDFTGFPVSPGDTIQASVFQSTSGTWETRVDDLSTGLSAIMVTGSGWGVYTDGSGGSFTDQGSAVGISYSGGYTAEWVEEDYKSAGALTPFADYGTVVFSDLGTSLGSWSLTPSEALEIVQDGQVLSTPSAPSGGNFSVSYTG